MTLVEERYNIALKLRSDIKEHIPFLSAFARGNILEFGVRDGISTAAFLYGIERQGGILWSVDKNPECGKLFSGHPLWRFIQADSCDVTRIIDLGLPGKLDIVFLDTEHDYEHVSNELTSWHTMVDMDGMILVHDVIEYGQAAGRACEDFSKCYGWNYVIRPGSNGLGILNRRM